MLRISILATALTLSACSPSFDDKLAGTWDCKPEDKVPDVSVNIAMTYARDGNVTGEMTVEEKAGEDTMLLRGSLDGTWDYDGETLGHKMTEEFVELKRNDEVVPREEIDPGLIASFRSEDSYDDPVDLVEDELVWYNDDERTQVSARCAKRG